jgi:hypothetical protein
MPDDPYFCGGGTRGTRIFWNADDADDADF